MLPGEVLQKDDELLDREGDGDCPHGKLFQDCGGASHRFSTNDPKRWLSPPQS
jgi:hypothetical protein